MIKSHLQRIQYIATSVFACVYVCMICTVYTYQCMCTRVCTVCVCISASVWTNQRGLYPREKNSNCPPLTFFFSFFFLILSPSQCHTLKKQVISRSPDIVEGRNYLLGTKKYHVQPLYVLLRSIVLLSSILPASLRLDSIPPFDNSSRYACRLFIRYADSFDVLLRNHYLDASQPTAIKEHRLIREKTCLELRSRLPCKNVENVARESVRVYAVLSLPI